MNFNFGSLANEELPGAANRELGGTSHSHDSFMQAVLDALAANGNGEIVWNEQDRTWKFLENTTQNSSNDND